MDEQTQGVLDVMGGNKPLQLSFASDELLKIGVTIFFAMFIALLFHGLIKK